MKVFMLPTGKHQASLEIDLHILKHKFLPLKPEISCRFFASA
jgi:hypothetical protein